MSNKKKSPCTAATVAGASNNIQVQDSTKQQDCKPFSDIEDQKLGTLTKIIHMEELHYQDGLEGKPYCNDFTYDRCVAIFGASLDGDEGLKGFFDFCDIMFRESWEKGKADATGIAVGA